MTDYLQQNFLGNSLQNYLVSLVIGLVIASVLYITIALSIKILHRRASHNIFWRGIHLGLQHTNKWVLLYLSLYFTTLPLAMDTLLQKVLLVGLIVVLSWQIIRFLELITEFFVKQRLNNSNNQSNNLATLIIQKLLKLSLWIISIIFILSNLDINVTSLIAGLGIGGIAFALAAQNILQDLFSSLAIILDKPFNLGDLIEVSGTRGYVRMIGIKTTRLEGLNGEEIIITNREITNGKIINYRKTVPVEVKST